MKTMMGALVELESELRSLGDFADRERFDTRCTVGEHHVQTGRQDAFGEAADMVGRLRESLSPLMVSTNGTVTSLAEFISAGVAPSS